LKFFKKNYNEDQSLNEERLSLEKKLEELYRLYIISKDLTKNFTAKKFQMLIGNAVVTNRNTLFFVAVKYRAKTHLTIQSSLPPDKEANGCCSNDPLNSY
jgi:tRNA A22 N-methylase